MNGLQLPRWIVPITGIAAFAWAIAMWWMVASLPASGASSGELDLMVARAEIDRLEIAVDELSQQVSALHQERGELSLRVDMLEETPAAMAAQMMQPSAPIAGPTPTVPVDDDDGADPADDDAASEPTATPGAVTATPTPATATPTAVPTAAPTAAPEPIIEPVAATPITVEYFTDGRDRYNCKDFNSWEEAQAAYEANLPGDPNKIDIDRNGVACEALR